MLRFVALLGVVSTALLASCGPSTSVPDAGPHIDAAEHDAGPWPAFAPRLQVSHPEVVCPPTAAVTYTPPARQPRRAGELYFVHPISRDPNALAPWRSVFGGALAPPIEVNLVAMTGIANGGVSIVVHGGRRGETPLYSEAGILVVDGLGDYQTVLPWFGGESFETHVDEGPYPLEAANGWQLHRRMGVLSDGATDIGFNLLAPAPGVTIAHPEFDEAIARSAPAVFLDRGIVVFVAYDGLLVSACLGDGQLRWVLEYDPPRGATPDPHLIGLSDGSVVANLGGAMRVSERGVVMASRDRGYVMGSPSCGVAVQPDTGTGLDWWSLDDFSVIAHTPAAPAEAAGRSVALGETCTQYLHAPLLPMITLERGGRVTNVGYYAGSPPIPTDDGSVIVLTSPPLSVLLVRDNGDVGWVAPLDASVGQRLVPAANVLMPDGTLYFATGDDFGPGNDQLVAVETGARPGWDDGRDGNWARTSAPLPATAMPVRDAGVDAGAFEIGVLDAGDGG